MSVQKESSDTEQRKTLQGTFISLCGLFETQEASLNYVFRTRVASTLLLTRIEEKSRDRNIPAKQNWETSCALPLTFPVKKSLSYMNANWNTLFWLSPNKHSESFSNLNHLGYLS